MPANATDLPTPITPRGGDALLLVDVQNDFLPGGTLAVPHGTEILPVANRLISSFARRDLPIYATRDWHPEKHCSFHAQGGPWPAHCVACTRGAAFAPALALPRATEIISKATRPETDAYSGFEGTDLHDRLASLAVGRIVVGGLATDYCVLRTALDALRLGYHVLLVVDAIRAVDVKSGDGDRAIEQMRNAGAIPIVSSQISE